MTKKIHIWHAIVCCLLLLVIVRFDEALITIKMLFVYMGLLFSEYSLSIGLINGRIVDQFTSVILILALLFLTIYLKKKYLWLNRKCSQSELMLIFLFLLFLFAPLLAPYDDNLQFNLPQAKRLAPLSKRHLVVKHNYLYENKKLGLFREYENMLFRDYVSSDYYITDKPIKSISREIKTKEITFVLGTDEYGRDILSRIIYATRYSLMISLLAILISGILGVLLGFVSGYYGRLTDLVLNRIVEMFLSIPFVFLVILSVAFLGDSLATVILVLGLAGWMSLFKVVRGEVLKLKTKDHIITAKMIGMSLPSLLTKEYFPLLFPSVSVNLVFQFAFILVAESSLSFLGITGNYSHPSLGGMMQQGFASLYNAWWISLFPTLVITWIFFIVQNVVRKMSGAKSNIFH